MRDGVVKAISKKILTVLLSIAVAVTFIPALGGIQQASAATGYSNEYPYLLNVDYDKVYNINMQVGHDYEYYGYDVRCIYEITVFKGSYTRYSSDSLPTAPYVDLSVDCVNSYGFELIEGTKIDGTTLRTSANGQIKFRLPAYDYTLDEEYGMARNVIAQKVMVGLKNGGKYTWPIGGTEYPYSLGTPGRYISLTEDAEKDEKNLWTDNWDRPLSSFDKEEQDILKKQFKDFAEDLSKAFDDGVEINKLPSGHDYFFKDPDIRKLLTSDQKRAKEVTEKVDILPAAENLTLDDKDNVKDAESAYNNLTDKQKELVDDDTKAKLDAAVAKIAELEAATQADENDKAAAEAVKAKINALPGTDALTLNDKTAVQDAQDAFDALTDKQEALIDDATNKKLSDAVAKIAELEAAAQADEKDKAAAEAVKAKINALPPVKQLTLDDKKAVQDAKEAFDALTDKQEALIDNAAKEKLETALEKIADLEALAQEEENDKAAADAVKDKINKLPRIADLTLDDKTAVQDAKDAFDTLTDKQKALIDEAIKDKLDAAVAKIEQLEALAQADEKDKETAKTVKDEIDSLPDTGKLTLDDKDKVDKTKAAYDDLTDIQKALIDYETKKKLEEALAKIKELENIWNNLQNNITNAENILNNGKDYTDETKKALQDAIDAAKGLDKNAAAEALQSALKKIEDAVKGLVEKGNDPNQMGTDGTPVGAGASAVAVEKFLTSNNVDDDPKGSKFAPLKFRSHKQSKKNIKLTWTKSKKATKYVIYGNSCGWTKKLKKLTTVKGKTFNVKKIKSAKLKKGKMYKFIVVALNKNNRVVSTSKMIHVATHGGKITNHKTIHVTHKKSKKWKKVKNVSVKKGKYIKLKAKFTKQHKNKKVHHHHAGVKGARYESTNAKVAKVNKHGIIIGKKKGTCKVYVYAHHGLYKVVKVKVK